MSGWIGVDLDGTLAHYEGWQGIEHIGPPIPKMMERVRRWIREGREVRIFTARCAGSLDGKGGAEEAVAHIRAWLESHGLGQLVITNIKDAGMDELWDDRCVRVELNTGTALCASPRGLETP